MDREVLSPESAASNGSGVVIRMSDTIDLTVLQGDPTITGSVQDMYALQYNGEDCYIAQTLDGGSAFDVGTFFSIPGSGAARSMLRHAIFCQLAEASTWQSLTEEDFAACISDAEAAKALRTSSTMERLCRDGARTHHLGLINPETGEVTTTSDVSFASNMVLFRRFPVLKPRRVPFGGKTVYDYSEYLAANRKVLALENVVRLGVPGGSSIYDRYQKTKTDGGDAAAFLALYGLAEPLHPWTMLPDLVCDWATKYEAYDRHLTEQEAALISSLPGHRLDELVELLKLSTVMTASIFRRAGLQLWDLKWEVAIDEDGTLVLVDTMDHDSVRITRTVDVDGQKCVVHFNKQAVRDFYRIMHPEWHKALDDAKRRSSDDLSHLTFMQVYVAGVEDGVYPPIPELDPGFAMIQGRKYEAVNEAVHGGAVSRVNEAGLQELDYFRSKGCSEELLQRNGTARPGS